MPGLTQSKTHPLDARIRPPFWTGEARPCAEPGCATLLSGYNPGPKCLLHTPAKQPTDRARSAELEREAKRSSRLLASHRR